jgi:hypothetical protein
MLDHHPRALSGKRDLRIDFFRGVALYMILVDHVVGDPISKFTYQRIGFSDAAEQFVFLSGVSCAIVYSRVLERRGWAGLLTSIARRTTKIYAFYLVTCAAVILLISAVAGSPVTAPEGSLLCRLRCCGPNCSIIELSGSAKLAP